ncbi:MAG TPA: protein kinase [Polyangiales bacterium]|nr:protein kinase [Polyangiales bacterium]
MAQCPFDGETLVNLPDPLIGRVIQERYLIEELIGSGGMGSVYRGSHQLLGRRVALKFLMPKLAQDVSSRTRFLREARAVNRVQHEHIIDVSDVGETEDSLVYMVMEYLHGRTLGEDISNGPISLPRVCHIGRQLALALARAHELDVVHRDVKPGNVFLIHKGSDTDYLKLLDFGLARAKDDVTITKSNLLFGTPEYMAPEQASGASVGAKADLYAFGCVLFEMVTGKLPFEGAPTGLIYKHVYEQPPRPRTFRPETPEDLDALILKLLHKDPLRRPSNGYEVADELTRCAAQLPRVSARAMRSPSLEPPEMGASGRSHEEDVWQDNLQSLRERLANEAKGHPAEATQAVERAVALVSQTQALRREFGALSVSNAQRHETDRATMLRIGSALDTLALDEARTATEADSIKSEQRGEIERLEHEIRRLLAAVHTFDSDKPDSKLTPADLLRVARDWAGRQEQVLVLREKFAEKEAAKADLRFQISHLKGRLASLEAASQADLEPVQARAAELEGEISKNLAEIRQEADRVTRHLGKPPPASSQKASG